MTHPYDMSYDAPPPNFSLDINNLFFHLLMILGLPKNPQSGRACAPGGAPLWGAGDPRPWDGLWGFWHRPGVPLQGDERVIGDAPSRHQGGTGWGGSGKEGKEA